MAKLKENKVLNINNSFQDLRDKVDQIYPSIKWLLTGATTVGLHRFFNLSNYFGKNSELLGCFIISTALFVKHNFKGSNYINNEIKKIEHDNDIEICDETKSNINYLYSRTQILTQLGHLFISSGLLNVFVSDSTSYNIFKNIILLACGAEMTNRASKYDTELDELIVDTRSDFISNITNPTVNASGIIVTVM